MASHSRHAPRNHTHDPGRFRVFVSLGAFKHASLIRLSVESALTFVDPHRLALHISAGSSMRAVFSRPHRVVHNPRHLRVSKAGPEVLAIHLSNVELLLHHLPAVEDRPAGMDRILFLPGNFVFLRPCRPLLEAAPLSLSIESFSDVSFIPRARSATGWSQPPIRNSALEKPQTKAIRECSDRGARKRRHVAPTNCSAVPRQYAYATGEPRWATNLELPPSEAWNEFARQLRVGDDSATTDRGFCSKNYYFRTSFNFACAGENTTMIDNLPLIVSIHEGSWYPALVLRAALHAFSGTSLSWRRLAEQCPFGGWCTIEESVLPSFAWQQFPKLASKARPQLIARVVVPPTCASVCGDCHGDARSLASVVKHVMSKPSVWCGLKLTADDANETATEMLLREVQQPHRAFCSSKGQRHIFDE